MLVEEQIMDFQYAFRQAHKDRLEDAGVVQYRRPTDGFRVRKATPTSRRAPLARLRPVLLSIIHLLVR
jgi:hypothetical protein